MSSKARFILSLDFELGWGHIESGKWRSREYSGVYKKLRTVLPRFLSQLDILDIPVTWAFVGAMLEEPGHVELSHLPSEIRTITRSFSESAESTTCDARDLFDKILSTNTQHKLCSHTYSHVRFNYNGLDSSFIETEMQLFDHICEKYQVQTDSLIFPQNIEGFHDQLLMLGYQSVRTAPNTQKSRNRALHLLSSVTNPPPLSITETMDSGLRRHSGSIFYNTGVNRLYRLPLVYKQTFSGINHAIRNSGTIHIWIHPFNLAESSLLLASLMHILKYVSAKREQGLIEIATF